jgi:choline dehydrogenase
MNDAIGPLYKQVIAGVRYLLFRSGPLTYSTNQGGAFLKTRPELDRPDTQLYFTPISFDHSSKTNKKLQLDNFSGITFVASPCRPESRGRLEIKSRDVDAQPAIYPNYLATDNDVRTMVDSLKILQRISQTNPMAEVIEAGVRPAGRKLDDEQLEAHAKMTCKTTYHPTSTCTMGVNTNTSVVDPRLKVHGINKLRVIDASITPLMISGNTNAMSTMIGEKGSDLVLADHR